MADTPTTPVTPAPSTPPAPTTTPATTTPPPGSPPPTGADADKVPSTWEDVFKHPRFEQLNTTAKEAKTQLEKIEKEKQDAARQKEIEAGNFQKVIDELNPKAARAEKLEGTIKTIVENELKAIPEDRRSLVPTGMSPEDQLDYITKNRAMLMGDKKTINKQTNPGTGGGDNNADDQRIFTQAEIENVEFYRKNRDAIQKAQREGRVRG